jgi:hypothetical protein
VGTLKENISFLQTFSDKTRTGTLQLSGQCISRCTAKEKQFHDSGCGKDDLFFFHVEKVMK